MEEGYSIGKNTHKIINQLFLTTKEYNHIK